MLGINFHPEPIGIGKYSGELAQYLVEEGFDVVVVTAYPHYPWWSLPAGGASLHFRKEVKDGVTIIRCPLYVPRQPKGPGRMLQDFSFFLSAWLAVSWLLLKGLRVDWVYSVIPSFPTAFLGGWVKLFRRNALWVVHIMDFQVDAALALGLMRYRWIGRCLARSEQWMLRRADRVSTLSAAMAARIVEKGVHPSRVLQFPNWVDVGLFHPGTPVSGSLSGLGIPSQGRMVLYSGAMGEKQCLDLLPSLALALRHACPDIFFVMAGEGPYRRQLETDCRSAGLEQVYFISIQPEPLFIALLQSAWLHLVLQRDTEEALYMPSKLGPIWAVGGCALVTAAPDSALGALIRKGQLGQLAYPATVSCLTQTIIDLYSDPLLHQQYKTSALHYARAHLEKKRIIGDYLIGLGLGQALSMLPAEGKPASESIKHPMP